MTSPRQVTIVGPDPSGYSWTCGACGDVGTGEASTDSAMAAFDTHWESTSIPPCEPWLVALLTAGQTLDDAAGSTPGWGSAIAQVPADKIASWRAGNDVHPL
jgi:hypothetical protein